MNCPSDCALVGSFHERCCGFSCTCCESMCRVDGCVVDGGCDVVAQVCGILVLVEVKSGNVARGDAEDGVRQLARCARLVSGEALALLVYGKMIDAAAMNYIYRERNELRVAGVRLLAIRCGDDICRVVRRYLSSCG